MNSSCEICGREDVVAVISLEGAKMQACRNCSSHGKILYKLSQESKPEKTTAATAQAKQSEEIVENFGQTIRNGRDKLGLPVAVVAERINERESYIEQIERGHLRPTAAVAKKLEHELGIKLVEKVVEEAAPSAGNPNKSHEITLADYVEVKKK